MADYFYICTNCGLRMYGDWGKGFSCCPACGCVSCRVEVVEFGQLPEEERMYRLGEI